MIPENSQVARTPVRWLPLDFEAPTGLVQLEAFLSRSRIRVCLVRMVIHGQGQGSEGTQSRNFRLEVGLKKKLQNWKDGLQKLGQ